HRRGRCQTADTITCVHHLSYGWMYRARPGSHPERAHFVCGEGLLLLGVLVVLLGGAEGLVVHLLAVDHGVLERVRSAVVHDSADDGVLFVATHSSVGPFFAGR